MSDLANSLAFSKFFGNLYINSELESFHKIEIKPISELESKTHQASGEYLYSVSNDFSEFQNINSNFEVIADNINYEKLKLKDADWILLINEREKTATFYKITNQWIEIILKDLELKVESKILELKSKFQ